MPLHKEEINCSSFISPYKLSLLKWMAHCWGATPQCARLTEGDGALLGSDAPMSHPRDGLTEGDGALLGSDAQVSHPRDVLTEEDMDSHRSQSPVLMILTAVRALSS